MRRRRAKTKKVGKPCPRCGVGRVIPIVYGYPGQGMFEQAQRGEIALGGCVIMPGQPHTTECPVCHFGRDERLDDDLEQFLRGIPWGDPPGDTSSDTSGETAGPDEGD